MSSRKGEHDGIWGGEYEIHSSDADVAGLGAQRPPLAYVDSF